MYGAPIIYPTAADEIDEYMTKIESIQKMLDNNLNGNLVLLETYTDIYFGYLGQNHDLEISGYVEGLFICKNDESMRISRISYDDVKKISKAEKSDFIIWRIKNEI